MLTTTTGFNTAIKSPVRTVKARVEVYEASTLVATYTQDDRLQSIEIQRASDNGLFFGFGICQRLNVKLRDPRREVQISTAHKLKIYFGAGNGEVDTCSFFVSEVHRDENTNQLSITAYDALYPLANQIMPAQSYDTVSLDIFAKRVWNQIGNKISGVVYEGFTSSYWTTSMPEPNYEGSETIREVLDDLAEVSQSIYFIDNMDRLQFKRLPINSDPSLTISREDYFTLTSGENRRLQTITHATELGDNYSVSTTQVGSTQIVRNNGWWENDPNLMLHMNIALAAVGDMTINQFDCSWRGNPALEIGDKIALVTKDGATAISYILDDVLSYDGTLSQKTRWAYSDEGETESNPVSIGDALKQTFARVDKVNKQIDLVVSDIAANSEAISALQLNADSINASVKELTETTTSAFDGINEEIATLTNKVEATMTAEDVTIAIKSELSNGVHKVETETGFTFNEEGLTVSKSNSEMTTTITENGMTVYKNEEAVLVADKEGVKAEDLHATTYLIIGNNSRFEDYGDRTGCFWIGS